MASVPVHVAPDDLRADVVALRLRLEDLLDALTDDQTAAPSLLAGWTRGHALAHLSGVGSAVARQLEHARAGRLVEFYDGGRAGRDRAIEVGAVEPAAALARDVRTAALRAESALAALDPGDWEFRTLHRDRTAREVAQAWWRELGIHLTDLDLGVASDVWTPALRENIVAYLGARVPAGARFVLRPDDGTPGWDVGAGAEFTVRGSAADLVALLAGRQPRGALAITLDGAVATLPELGPWP